MSAREESARKFAAAMGDKIIGECFLELRDLGEVPDADAPLSKQLEFVGRVAEALPEWKLTACGWYADSWSVQFSRQSGDNGSESFEWSESDPAWAAMDAATAAKESSK